MFNRDLGVLDMNIYDYESLFGIHFNMNKKNRLEYGDSQMTHAMLLTGVNINKSKPEKWKIENSWGTKSGNNGYLLMTDKWFDEYTYEVVIDKKYLNKKIINRKIPAFHFLNFLILMILDFFFLKLTRILSVYALKRCSSFLIYYYDLFQALKFLVSLHIY